MANDSFQYERVLPCLLLRLKAGASGKQTVREYHQSVREDMYALLNTARPSLDKVVEKYPRIGRSVLNFGFQSLSGKVSTNVEKRSLQRDIEATLSNFEPRIAPDSIKVSVLTRNFGDPLNELAFEVEGELWAQPVQHLQLQTQVDLETGEVAVVEERPR